MRPIIFRGKRVDNGEWAYGSLINNAFVLSATKEPIPYIFSLDSGADCWEDMNDDDDFKEVIPETVGQFTGLTDKTGVKIFEGDIVKTDSGAIQKVEYRSDMAMFVLRFNKGASTGLTSKCEVIGNIHDNPDLLNGID